MPHVHERIDFTVEVFVIHIDRVLLRRHDKYGLWLSVGGHVELDEDPNQAALREVKEEVGLDVTLVDDAVTYHERTADYQELVPPRFLNRHRISPTHEHICLTYFARVRTDQVRPGGPDRSDEWVWLSAAEVQAHADLRPSVRHYALTALREAGH